MVEKSRWQTAQWPGGEENDACFRSSSETETGWGFTPAKWSYQLPVYLKFALLSNYMYRDWEHKHSFITCVATCLPWFPSSGGTYF